MDDTHAPGDVVDGRYRVVSLLGKGGAGITYESEELATGTRVALKQLRLWHGQDWKVLELFQREAAVLIDAQRELRLALMRDPKHSAAQTALATITAQ